MAVTRDMLERDRDEMQQRLRQLTDVIRQATADANAIRGALEYIDRTLKGITDGGDDNRESVDASAESARGADSAVLER